MTEADPPSPYAIPLDDLVRATRVPFADQTTEQATSPVPQPAEEEERRQFRLAGGA